MISVLVVVALAIFIASAPNSAVKTPCPAMLRHEHSNLMDDPVSRYQFAGRVVLIVNTASECGYTPQYDGMEKLYRRYRDKGFMVL